MPDSEAPITVSVTLRSILRKFRPNPKDRSAFPVRLEPGSTIANLTDKLGVHEKLAKLVFVDHVRCDRATVLHDGARVDIFPPIAGG